MTIQVFMDFDVTEDKYSKFLKEYRRKILKEIPTYYKRLGVIAPGEDGEGWKWVCVRITNRDRTIEVAMHLNSLYIYGFRRVLKDDKYGPRWMMKGHEKVKGFSGIEGEIKSLDFVGAYRSKDSDQSLTWSSFNSAIYVLDNFAASREKDEETMDEETKDEETKDEEIKRPDKEQTKNVESSFILMVLYLAEALKILPIREQIIEGFDSHVETKPGDNMNFARNWDTLSCAFFSGDYSRVSMDCKDEKEARLILGMLKFSTKKDYESNDTLPGDGPEADIPVP